jgi:hypothetical protein
VKVAPGKTLRDISKLSREDAYLWQYYRKLPGVFTMQVLDVAATSELPSIYTNSAGHEISLENTCFLPGADLSSTGLSLNRSFSDVLANWSIELGGGTVPVLLLPKPVAHLVRFRSWFTLSCMSQASKTPNSILPWGPPTARVNFMTIYREAMEMLSKSRESCLAVIPPSYD